MHDPDDTPAKVGPLTRLSSLFASDRSALQSPSEDPSSEALHRNQIIERILRLNPTASVQFLDSFGPNALSAYLDHLDSADQPRGSGSRWTRTCDTPAIVCRARSL